MGGWVNVRGLRRGLGGRLRGGTLGGGVRWGVRGGLDVGYVEGVRRWGEGVRWRGRVSWGGGGGMLT